jgi:hypothetical protein
MIERKITKTVLTAFILSIFVLCSFTEDSHRLSVHMESQRLANGKVIKIVADIYYKYSEAILTMHYTYPNDYVLMTNSKGEIKVYYPKRNEVIIQQNNLFSSENDMLFMFLSNKQNDLGLNENGFRLTSSTIKNKIQITIWTPPAYKIGELSKIELVHENNLPIYIAYYNVKSTIFKKIYYSNYYMSSLSPFPQKIVEIDYIPTGDSIVSRKIYTNIKIGNQINSPYFNYSIPKNAKISVQKK